MQPSGRRKIFLALEGQNVKFGYAESAACVVKSCYEDRNFKTNNTEKKCEIFLLKIIVETPKFVGYIQLVVVVPQLKLGSTVKFGLVT